MTRNLTSDLDKNSFIFRNITIYLSYLSKIFKEKFFKKSYKLQSFCLHYQIETIFFKKNDLAYLIKKEKLKDNVSKIISNKFLFFMNFKKE